MTITSLALTFAFTFTLALPARADETSPNSARSDQNTARTNTVGNDASTENTRAKMETKSDEAKVAENNGSKAMLAPHALMIRTSLESALSQVKGMKSQLDEVAFDPKTSAQQFQTYGMNLKGDLKLANTHQEELKSSIRKFPDLASSEEFRNIDTALTDVRTSASSWMTKSTGASYWQNKDRAMNDLKDLEKRLNDAIDKTRSFSTAKLDLSRSFG